MAWLLHWREICASPPLGTVLTEPWKKFWWASSTWRCLAAAPRSGLWRSRRGISRGLAGGHAPGRRRDGRPRSSKSTDKRSWASWMSTPYSPTWCMIRFSRWGSTRKYWDRSPARNGRRYSWTICPQRGLLHSAHSALFWRKCVPTC